MAPESRKLHYSTQNQKLHQTVFSDFFRKKLTFPLCFHFTIIISRAKNDWPLATSLVLYRLTNVKIMFEKYRGYIYPRVFGAKSDAKDKRLISSVQFDCFDFSHLCLEIKWALFYVRTWILIKHDNNFRIFNIMLSFGF